MADKLLLETGDGMLQEDGTSFVLATESVDVTVALTGVSSTSTSGLLGVALGLALTGLAATANAGDSAVLSQGPNSASTIVNDASVGAVAWSNPSNAGASDNVYATVNLGSAQTSNYLKATAFGFSIPTGATVQGVLVEIERSVSAGSVNDIIVKLVKAGTPVGTGKNDLTNWAGTDAYAPYGSSSDLWGLTWTPAEINASDFGIVLEAIGLTPGSVARVDHIRLTVSYQFVDQISTTVALTGVAGTSSAGTATPSQSLALTGTASTTATGTVTPSGGDVVSHPVGILTQLMPTGGPGQRYGSFSRGADVSVALTGVSVTGSVGTLAQSRTVALTGVSGTGSLGTLTPSQTLALTGVSSTGTVGTATPSTTKALTGNAATGSVGTVTPSGGDGGNVTLALTGVSSTSSVGTLTPSTSTALTGTAGTSTAGTVAPTSTKALTGNAATGSVGTLTPSASKAMTGTASTGSVGTLAPTTTIALTGSSATGAVGTVTPSGGDGGNVSVALTGVSSTSSVGTLTPSRTVALTGTSATSTAGTAAARTDRALTGQGATGSVGTLTPTSSSTVALTGVSATASRGTLAPSTDKALTGTTSTGSLGSVAQAISVALSGVSGTGASGTMGSSSPSNVTLTGVQAIGSVGSVFVSSGPPIADVIVIVNADVEIVQVRADVNEVEPR